MHDVMHLLNTIVAIYILAYNNQTYFIKLFLIFSIYCAEVYIPSTALSFIWCYIDFCMQFFWMIFIVKKLCSVIFIDVKINARWPSGFYWLRTLRLNTAFNANFEHFTIGGILEVWVVVPLYLVFYH